MKTKRIYVKALTLEETINYYSKKKNLYRKNGKFNVISVGAICKCAGLLYAHVDPSEEKVRILADRDQSYYVENTGDIVKDITTIWNISKEVLEYLEISKETKKYNL